MFVIISHHGHIHNLNSAKINIFLPFGVAFNSLLSVTSVNLTGSEHTFILAQLIFQSWSDTGTEESASTLAVFDSYSNISCSGQQLFRIFPLRGYPKSLGISFHAVDKQIKREIFTKIYVLQNAFFPCFNSAMKNV